MRASTILAAVGTLLAGIAFAAPSSPGKAANVARAEAQPNDLESSSTHTVHIFDAEPVVVPTSTLKTIFIQPIHHKTATLTITRQLRPPTVVENTQTPTTAVVSTMAAPANTTSTTSSSGVSTPLPANTTAVANESTNGNATTTTVAIVSFFSPVSPPSSSDSPAIITATVSPSTSPMTLDTSFITPQETQLTTTVTVTHPHDSHTWRVHAYPHGEWSNREGI